MARTRNSAATAKARRARPVSARTMARRARQAEAAQEAQAAQRGGRETREPETLGQARVWERKNRRYLLAGLCDVDAANAAWGHAEGWGSLDKAGRNPCAECQPFVNMFPSPGPRGSKWRKILTKLEYMTEEELGEWLDKHYPPELL